MPEITYRTELPGLEEYHALFETTGWNDGYRASPRELMTTLERSWARIFAYDGDTLVATGRVVSDGVLYGMIYDLITLPSHQGRGIGSVILERLVARCQDAGLRGIQLYSARGKADFYAKRGFVPRPDDGPGMTFVEPGS